MATKTNSFRSLIAASGQAPVVTEAATEATHVLPAKKSRPVGKRTAPDYVQVGLYLPKQLHRKAKLALLGEEEERDFSELVRDLLSEYLQKSGA